MKRTLLLGALAVVLIWTVLSALTQVQPGELAVVRRFGRVLEDKPGPGLFVGLPWGLDQVDRVPMGREHRVAVGVVGKEDEQRDTPAGQLLTGDHNLVNLQVEVFYTVVKDQVDKFVLHADRADALVARVTEAVLAEWIAGRPVDEVLRDGKTLLRSYLPGQVQARMDAYGIGIQIRRADINQIYPPEEVKEAFDRLAQAFNTIETYVNKAEQEADRKKREADSMVFHIQRLTASYVKQQRLLAQVDATNFLNRQDQYRKLAAGDPHYLNALWQDEMTRLYGRMRETGRIDLLDHYLSSDGLNITQFPLLPKKK